MADENDAGFVPVNRRDTERWALIEPEVTLKSKKVLDVGCGYGDVMMRACMAGAKTIVGVDKDAMVIGEARERLAGCPGVLFYEDDLVKWLSKTRRRFDYAFCLSVLPYVDMARMLDLLVKKSKVTVIECQYLGDGPGTVSDDREMRAILSDAGWTSVKRLGAVPLAIRPAERTVWLCLSD